MKIVIPHSWSPNIGDMALLSSTVKTLKQVIPDAEITALVSDPDLTEKELPGLDAKLLIWPWPIPKGKRTLLDLASYPFIYLSHFFSVMAYRLARQRIFIFNKRYSMPLKSMFECDMVVSPGGDFISPRYNFITALTEVLFAKMLGKKLVIFPQTMGPFTGLLNGQICRRILNQADLIFLREKETEKLLRNIGVNNFHVTADIVFTSAPIQKIIKRKTIIICTEDVKSAAYEDYFAELTKRIAAEGFDVLYVPANGADIAINKRLAQRTGSKSLGKVPGPKDLAELISECEFLVSGRMHPVILGTLSGTPFFVIGDGFKFSEILGDLCEACWMELRWIKDEKSMDIILEKIKERDALHKKINENLPKVREKALSTSSILEQKIREWNSAEELKLDEVIGTLEGQKQS